MKEIISEYGESLIGAFGAILIVGVIISFFKGGFSDLISEWLINI